MANQVQTGYNNLQAGEAKQVTPGFNRPNLSPNLTQSQLAGNITGGGGNLTFGGGQNVTRDYSKTDLGKAGIDPSMVGGYGINLGDQKLSPAEFRNIGAERDSLVNNYGKPAHLSTPVGGPRSIAELENLSQYNRALGLNQTSGMGFGESFRHNLGGLEAQRDFAQLGNMAKGIGNLMPGRALMTGLLNKIPGVNLPTQLSMSPINYNITDQMQGSELANILSKQQQEMYSPSLMNKYLFGSQPDAVTQDAVTQEGRQNYDPGTGRDWSDIFGDFWNPDGAEDLISLEEWEKDRLMPGDPGYGFEDMPAGDTNMQDSWNANTLEELQALQGGTLGPIAPPSILNPPSKYAPSALDVLQGTENTYDPIGWIKDKWDNYTPNSIDDFFGWGSP